MNEPTIRKVKLTDFTPDDHNPNRHTERGHWQLVESIRRFGAGRSGLLDRSGRIMAGNLTHEVLVAEGFEEAIVIETDGKVPVFVQRKDLDLDTPEGRGLAIADNVVQEHSLDWDVEALTWAQAQGADLGVWWTAEELDDLTNHWLQSQPPSLDELAEEYGEPEERAFWPIIRAQVSPETFDLWRSLLDAAPGEDEAAKVARVLGAVDATLLGG